MVATWFERPLETITDKHVREVLGDTAYEPASIPKGHPRQAKQDPFETGKIRVDNASNLLSAHLLNAR